MALSRIQQRSLVAAMFVQLYTGDCTAIPSAGPELNVCEYSLEDLYVVDVNATLTLFPAGYLSCANTSDSNAELCGICFCREKKVGAIAGLTVAGVVCVGSGDVTTCTGEGQEFCGRNDSIDSAANATSILQGSFSFNEDTSPGTSSLRDSSSSNEDAGVGDVAIAGSTVDPEDIGDTSAGSSSASSATSTQSFIFEPATVLPSGIDTSSATDSTASVETMSPDIDTSIPVFVPESINTIIKADTGSTDVNADTENLANASGSTVPGIDNSYGTSTDSSSTGGTSQSAAFNSNRIIGASSSLGISTDASGSTFESIDSSIRFDSLAKKESAVDEENVDSNTVGKVKPSPTSAAAPPTNQAVIRPQENGSTLGTNNGSSSSSSWSGERLTVLLSTICGIAVVAAIAAFVAVRRHRFKSNKELTTPIDHDYTDENFDTVTPIIPGNCGARNVSRGPRLGDAFENSPMASIVVLGPDDDFVPPPRRTTKRHYRSYPRNTVLDTYARSGSTKSTKDVFTQDKRPSTVSIDTINDLSHQHHVSHGPPTTGLPVRAPYEIFDTSNTRERFSSGMSSQFDSRTSGQEYESDLSFNSFQMASETSSGTEFDSITSTNCNDRQTASDLESGDSIATSCLSSTESVQYNGRDTEASERTNGSEMDSDLSRVAISFDLSATKSRIS
uniref:Uncharacterized protein n=1 Tax=Hyaloperonospora arabidopsidis (strain Emoy2) TaxID=559515 RepID=M4C5E4_HYAAE